ncbi:MAG: hypothetical protein GAK44_00321 [Pseudomonas delhiensis]|nr:MAG: hypothetical protein GAK44_00321 [Pseudomonas delhiensis]
MRLFALLLCLALASCTHTPAPQARVSHPANARLTGLQRFELMPPENAVEALPYRSRYPAINARLRQGLSEHGYRESSTPQIRVYYWLALQDAPLALKVDNPPAEPFGPYLAIHRLRDETGTLRLRLTDTTGQTLWEASVSTGLSPARSSAALLQAAIDALLQQLPPAAP